jgi:hypothetical protein
VVHHHGEPLAGGVLLEGLDEHRAVPVVQEPGVVAAVDDLEPADRGDRSRLVDEATLMASVPIMPVSMAAYVPAPSVGVQGGTMPFVRIGQGIDAWEFSISMSPRTSASRPLSASRSLVFWRSSSVAESAPRHSTLFSGPHVLSSGFVDGSRV